MRPIGTGLSRGHLNATEQLLFSHVCKNPHDQNRTSFIPRGKDIQIYDDRGTSATQLGITGKYDKEH